MRAAAVALVLASTLAQAGEGEASEKKVEALGYFDSRTSFTKARARGILPAEDVPELQEMLELNLQVKAMVRARSFLFADASFVANFAGGYRSLDAAGDEVYLPDRNSTQAQPLVALSEAYYSHDFLPELNLVVGKKRITWGAGMAFNPTDLLNPRRDPTDPTFQRAGAWVAQLEAPLEQMTFSLLFAPTVTASGSGLPRAFMKYPDWNRVDDATHFQLAGRWYALIGDADVTLMAFYGNQSVDAFKDKLRFGFSFSRYFFTDYELHLEGLVQTGSPRDFLVSDCVAGPLQALGCAAKKVNVTEKSLLDEKAFYPRLLVGTKRQFSDDSMLSLEYLYQADGYTWAQWRDWGNALGLVQQGRAAGVPLSAVPGASSFLGSGTGTDGLPTRVTFDPRGQHYLFASYQKPRIADDFTLSVVLIANLTDFSTTWTPSVAWQATDWLTITAYGFLPIQGPAKWAPRTPDGTPVSEFSTSPFSERVMVEARAWF